MPELLIMFNPKQTEKVTKMPTNEFFIYKITAPAIK